MRTLYYVPTLHTVHETLMKTGRGLKELPPDMVRDHRAILRTWQIVWKDLNDRIASGTIDPKRLHVFSDGMPVRPGSLFWARLHVSPALRIIDRLHRLGARRRGTEKRGFLLAHALHIMCGPRDINGRRIATRFDLDIMMARDLFVALRMLRTVPRSHDALLFMGARHITDRYVHRLAPWVPIVRIDPFVRLQRRIYGLPKARGG